MRARPAIDLTFNPAVPNQYCHYTDKELFRFVDDVKSVGGAITINVPIDRANGHIPCDTHSQLVRLGKHLNGAVSDLCLTQDAVTLLPTAEPSPNTAQ